MDSDVAGAGGRHGHSSRAGPRGPARAGRRHHDDRRGAAVPDGPPPAPPRRRLVVGLVAMLALALAAVLVLVLVLGGDDDPVQAKAPAAPDLAVPAALGMTVELPDTVVAGQDRADRGPLDRWRGRLQRASEDWGDGVGTSSLAQDSAPACATDRNVGGQLRAQAHLERAGDLPGGSLGRDAPTPARTAARSRRTSATTSPCRSCREPARSGTAWAARSAMARGQLARSRLPKPSASLHSASTVQPCAVPNRVTVTR